MEFSYWNHNGKYQHLAGEFDVYRVTADRATGEWITEPTPIGRESVAEWHAREDDEGAHYDTFERDGATCAIEVRWAE